jgi:hypothetical protein
MAPLFDPNSQNKAGYLSVLGGMAFDANGVVSPLLADDSEPVTWWVFVGVATVLNLLYGALVCASGFETPNSDVPATTT